MIASGARLIASPQFRPECLLERRVREFKTRLLQAPGMDALAREQR